MNPIVVYADGADGPLSAPSVVAAAAGVGGSPEVLFCWTVAEPDWLNDPAVTGRTGMAGYGLANAVARGQIEPLSMRISAMPNLLRQARPDVVILTGVRRGTQLVYGQTVSWMPIATEAAHRVVVEIDEDGYDLGAPEITGNIVATLTRPRSEQSRAAARPADEIDLRIGALVASLVPDNATLQFGPGGIGEGIARALRKPVSIFSGLVTDAMADLADRGLLNGVVTAAYAWGGAPVRNLAASGRLICQRRTSRRQADHIDRWARGFLRGCVALAGWYVCHCTAIHHIEGRVQHRPNDRGGLHAQMRRQRRRH